MIESLPKGEVGEIEGKVINGMVKVMSKNKFNEGGRKRVHRTVERMSCAEISKGGGKGVN